MPAPRRLAAAAGSLLLVALAAGGWLSWGGHDGPQITRDRLVWGDPDPGGRALATIGSVRAAVPPSARVTIDQGSGFHGDLCDALPGTEGWGSASVLVRFTDERPVAEVLSQVAKVLTGAGWSHQLDEHPGARWIRPVGDGRIAIAALGRISGGAGQRDWDLTAIVEPMGHRSSGC
jgi:hypothetical protein